MTNFGSQVISVMHINKAKVPTQALMTLSQCSIEWKHGGINSYNIMESNIITRQYVSIVN